MGGGWRTGTGFTRIYCSRLHLARDAGRGPGGRGRSKGWVSGAAHAPGTPLASQRAGSPSAPFRPATETRQLQSKSLAPASWAPTRPRHPAWPIPAAGQTGKEGQAEVRESGQRCQGLDPKPGVNPNRNLPATGGRAAWGGGAAIWAQAPGGPDLTGSSAQSSSPESRADPSLLTRRLDEALPYAPVSKQAERKSPP